MFLHLRRILYHISRRTIGFDERIALRHNYRHRKLPGCFLACVKNRVTENRRHEHDEGREEKLRSPAATAVRGVDGQERQGRISRPVLRRDGHKPQERDSAAVLRERPHRRLGRPFKEDVAAKNLLVRILKLMNHFTGKVGQGGRCRNGQMFGAPHRPFGDAFFRFSGGPSGTPSTARRFGVAIYDAT